MVRRSRERPAHNRSIQSGSATVLELGGAERVGRKYDHAQESVMIRGLDGSINFWNSAAEAHYGWSRREALGNVSHLLLNTVFPCPLTDINQQLITQGYWEGELIHTLSDGMRVKVHSRWELKHQGSSDKPQVVEINKLESMISPETAHFSTTSSFLEILWKFKWWCIVPFVMTLLALAILAEIADPYPILPPLE